jgi:thymidylate synthase ThyX
MGQAGLTTFDEAKGDACHGIVDFSTDEASKRYVELLGEFLKAYETELQKGRAVTGIFEYPQSETKARA